MGSGSGCHEGGGLHVGCGLCLSLGSCVELDEKFRWHAAHGVVVNAAQVREALAEGCQGGVGHGWVLAVVVAMREWRLVFWARVGVLSPVPVTRAWYEISLSVAPGIVVIGMGGWGGGIPADGWKRIESG
jgi:hypothetical protein